MEKCKKGGFFVLAIFHLLFFAQIFITENVKNSCFASIWKMIGMFDISKESLDPFLGNI